jgi:hypothetical protein
VTAAAKDWFAVDKEGLAAILARRGIEFALFELVSNALDTAAKDVVVGITPHANRPLADVSVTDNDPHGFADLTHAFTLFAPSSKKSKIDKRGRFNLGEKLVLAVCDEATIASTTGTVTFDKIGRHDHPRQKRIAGSMFSGVLRMTRKDVARSIAALKTVLVPPGVNLVVNDETISPRAPLATFSATLATEVADADGNLKRGRAKAVVKIYEPLADETAALYEMGIPVVETGDRWHIDVSQKIPLNMDRDNVPPAFLRELRAQVMNAMADKLTPAIASMPWARDALGDSAIGGAAVEAAITARFGSKRASYDPSDPEANRRVVADGYVLVHGGSLSAGEWENVKNAGAIAPAGQISPTLVESIRRFVPREEWTSGILNVVRYAEELGKELLGAEIVVNVADEPGSGMHACYGSCSLTLNLGTLGHAWFEKGASEEVDRLLLHEFSHHYAADHLSSAFAEAGFTLGARLKRLALRNAEFFRRFES